MTGIPHLGFIVAAYGLAAVAVAAMIGAVLWDYRRLSAQLRGLEGSRRNRSDAQL